MEILVIGKPAVNMYVPLQEYPQEGDVFRIKSKNESVGNVGATSACLLAKWGMSTHLTGVVGNDGYAEKIREAFKTFRVDSKYMETDFTHGTAVNYNILNTKTGLVTKIIYDDPESQLVKYKYDFVPNFAIIDGTDYSGAFALLNNNGSVKTVFYGAYGDKDSITVSKRCTWQVVTEKFVEMLTKETADGSAEGYVELYQKIVDMTGLSSYIVLLNNHKILYCMDGKVKMLPEMKINIVDNSSFDSIFVGALSFVLSNDVALDDAIKFANTAAALSLTKIGEADAIPEVDDVLDNSGLREKLGLGSRRSAVTPVQSVDEAAQSSQIAQAQASVQNVTEPTANVVPTQAEVNQVLPAGQDMNQVGAAPQVNAFAQTADMNATGVNPNV